MLKRRKNKKGFLLGEFSLKTIIAIFGILLLVFLLFSLYRIYSNNSELRQAEATLEGILERVKVVNSEAVGTEQRDVLASPKDWVLSVSSGNSICERDCLCICQNLECENAREGICIEKNVEVSLSTGVIAINPTDVIIKKTQEGVSIEGVLNE